MSSSCQQMRPNHVRVFSRHAASLVPFSFFFFFTIISTKAVHVGVIVNTSSYIGKEQKLAIEIATRHFNSSYSPIFLNVTELSSSYDLLDITATARDLINWGAEAIIGAGAWPEVATLAKVGDSTRLPIISLATTTLAFSPQLPSLIQMAYPTSGEMHCLADVIRSYKWRRIIVIYEDDIYGSISGIIGLLSNALRANGVQIDHQIAFPTMLTVPNKTSMTYQKLHEIPQQLSKVFVVLRSSPELIGLLFKAAKDLGMMGKGHVWILSDDVASLLDSTLSPTFISAYMQGVIGISTYLNTTSSLCNNFSAAFHKEPGMQAALAYDAVGTIAQAAAAKSSNRSMTLLQGIRSSDFLGLSGSINFSKQRSDAPHRRDNQTFRVLNVVGKSYRELGFWLEGFGFFEQEGDLGHTGLTVDALLPVFWPGRTEKIPSGWGMLNIGVPSLGIFHEFVKVEYEAHSGKVKKVTGFCIDVFKEAVKLLDYDLVYTFIPFNGTYDDMVNQIPLKKFDAVVGDVTILAKRAVSVSFTVPFLSSGLSMVVPIKRNLSPWILITPFTKQVWLLILSTLVYNAIVIWYLERGCNPDFDGNWWLQLRATLWLTLSTIFFAHDKVYSYYTKVIVIPWLILVLILTTTFTANLSSIFVTEKLEPVPAGSRVGCDAKSFVVEYLQEVLSYKNQSIVRIQTSEDYNEAFKTGNISAAYLETPQLKHFLSMYDNYTVTGETYMLGGFGFAFAKDSSLSSDLSEAILKLAEDGTLKKLEKKWFSITLSNTIDLKKERKIKSINWVYFEPLFVFTWGTSSITLLLFRASLFLSNGVRTTRAVSFEHLRHTFRVWTARKRSGEQNLESSKVALESSDGRTNHGEGTNHGEAFIEMHHLSDSVIPRDLVLIM